MVFEFLIKMDPLLSIILISLIMSLVITILYKYLTDQKLMKQLKDEIKDYQKEMKTLRDNPKKMMKVQKNAMEANMKYMMHSLKPTLFTFIPVIIIFGWLNGHLAFYPIMENTDFTVNAIFEEKVTGDVELILPKGDVQLVSGDLKQKILDKKAMWTLKAKTGEYGLTYRYNDKEYSRDFTVTDDINNREFPKPVMTVADIPDLKNSGIKSLNVENQKIQPLKKYPLLGSIPWFGGFGWLGVYIVLSLVFSMVLRKIIKVY